MTAAGRRYDSPSIYSKMRTSKKNTPLYGKTHTSTKELNMKHIKKAWNALGTTGQLILGLTLFFFIAKTLGRR